MSSKSDKIQSHKKKTEKRGGESRKYAHICYDSVTFAAETIGISAPGEEISKQLAEDVSYRLREVIHNCSVHLRQNKRRKLLTADVNAVFHNSDVPAIYGHLQEEPLNFLFFKDAGVFVPEENDIDLVTFAVSDSTLSQKGEPFVKGTWLPPDGTSDVNASALTVKAEDSKSAPSNYEKCTKSSNISPHLLSYYSQTSKIILGNSENLFKVVLKDLRDNSKIGPVAPYLLNLLALGLQKLPKGESYTHFKYRFLQVAEALTCNSSIELGATISVHRIISSLLLCILDSTMLEESTTRCSFDLRNFAPLVLAKVVNRWCIMDNELQLDILQKLGSVLLDGSSSLHNHYSALRTLCALGYESLDYCLWPHLGQYLGYLEILRVQPDIKENVKSFSRKSRTQQIIDIMEIEDTILTAAEILYRRDSLPNQSSSSCSVMALENLLYSYFGDTLCARRPYFPISLQEEEAKSTNIVNGGEMEIDTFTSSVRKDTRNSDFEADFCSWRTNIKTSTSAQSVFINRNKITSDTLSKRRVNIPSTLTGIFGFKYPIKREQYSTTIQFNFAGANPVSKACLKRRLLDHKHAQLVCKSDYFHKSSQVGCIGKIHRQQRVSAGRSFSADIRTVL